VLDVDMNAKAVGHHNTSDTPIENVYWDAPPAGKYRFWVEGVDMDRAKGKTPFMVRCTKNGKAEDRNFDNIQEDEELEVWSFELAEARRAMQDSTIAAFHQAVIEKIVDFIKSKGGKVSSDHVKMHLGSLGVNKMCKVLNKKYSEDPSKMVAEAFAAFDLNHDGQITIDELTSVLHSVKFGAEVGSGAVDSLMSQIDTDGDGLISLAEFQKYAMSM
jgi:Ca2+-binding EF-hand superfamily protein